MYSRTPKFQELANKSIHIVDDGNSDRHSKPTLKRYMSSDRIPTAKQDAVRRLLLFLSEFRFM